MRHSLPSAMFLQPLPWMQCFSVNPYLHRHWGSRPSVLNHQTLQKKKGLASRIPSDMQCKGLKQVLGTSLCSIVCWFTDRGQQAPKCIRGSPHQKAPGLLSDSICHLHHTKKKFTRRSLKGNPVSLLQ